VAFASIGLVGDDACVGGVLLFDLLYRVVGAAVVDDDDLVVVFLLREVVGEVIESCNDAVLFVVGGYD